MKNLELKRRFLNNYSNKKTMVLYDNVLEKCSNTEEKFEKNVYEFNRDEFEELWASFRSTSWKHINKVVSIFRQFVDFANDEGYVPTKINYVNMFSGRDLIKYVSPFAIKDKIISYDKLIELQENCMNPQDEVIFALLFEGVKGKGHEEILNLKKTDVDYDNNILTLTRNDGSVRRLNVSERTIEIIREANEDPIGSKEYYFSNGLTAETSDKKSKSNLVDNDYIIRPSLRGDNNKNEPSELINIINRVKKISDFHGNQFLNPTNIWTAGMVHMAKTIKQEKGDLDIEDWKEITIRFGRNVELSYVTKKDCIDYI